MSVQTNERINSFKLLTAVLYVYAVHVNGWKKYRVIEQKGECSKRLLYISWQGDEECQTRRAEGSREE